MMNIQPSAKEASGVLALIPVALENPATNYEPVEPMIAPGDAAFPAPVSFAGFGTAFAHRVPCPSEICALNQSSAVTKRTLNIRKKFAVWCYASKLVDDDELVWDVLYRLTAASSGRAASTKRVPIPFNYAVAALTHTTNNSTVRALVESSIAAFGIGAKVEDF